MNNNNINQEDKRKLSQQRWRKKQKELIKKGDPVAIKRHEDRKAKNRISQQKWRKNIKKEKKYLERLFRKQQINEQQQSALNAIYEKNQKQRDCSNNWKKKNKEKKKAAIAIQSATSSATSSATTSATTTPFLSVTASTTSSTSATVSTFGSTTASDSTSTTVSDSTSTTRVSAQPTTISNRKKCSKPTDMARMIGPEIDDITLSDKEKKLIENKRKQERSEYLTLQQQLANAQLRGDEQTIDLLLDQIEPLRHYSDDPNDRGNKRLYIGKAKIIYSIYELKSYEDIVEEDDCICLICQHKKEDFDKEKDIRIRGLISFMCCQNRYVCDCCFLRSQYNMKCPNCQNAVFYDKEDENDVRKIFKIPKRY